MEEKPNADLQAQAIARDVLTLSRNSLMVNFRFLDRALARLQPVMTDSIPFGTDGTALYADPWFVVRLYRTEPSEVTRNLLHSALHCVFRHFLTGAAIDRPCWDLACDIAVENVIDSLTSPSIFARRSGDQQALLALLREETRAMNAEMIYAWLKEKNFPAEELQKQREPFLGDWHGIWYGSRDPSAKTDKNVNLPKVWEEISKRMQTELETIGRDRDSALVQNLRRLNRTRRSYTEFLKRFGVHGEEMRLSEEEFDVNYYSYGMNLYGNVPLVEPLEVSEVKRIREFVIAVDTSGSVQGETVQAFIQKTYDILRRRESFASRMTIHILQCDCAVRDDAVIHSTEDLEQYIRTMEIRGLGKTDFRPVFEHVSHLLESGQLTCLQGLLYFTDGEGIYPEKQPPYDTAFILHNTGMTEPEIPAWAMKLILEEGDILDKRG